MEKKIVVRSTNARARNVLICSRAVWKEGNDLRPAGGKGTGDGKGSSAPLKDKLGLQKNPGKKRGFDWESSADQVSPPSRKNRASKEGAGLLPERKPITEAGFASARPSE